MIFQLQVKLVTDIWLTVCFLYLMDQDMIM